MLPDRISYRVLFLVTVLAMMMPAAAAAQAAVDSAALPAALHTARKGFNGAIVARDANAAGAFVADSAMAEFGAEHFMGKTAFIQNFLAPQFQTITAIRFGAPKFSRSGDEVLETATYYVKPVEDPTEQTGQSTVTWRRTGGAWKVVKLVVLTGGQ